MKIKKKLFKSVKNKYISSMDYAKKQEGKYKELLNNYNPKYGSKNYLIERFTYYTTVIEFCNFILLDLECMEKKI